MIYTSYFANLRNLPQTAVRISIARYSDKFPEIPKYEKLMPSKQLVFKLKNGIYNQYKYIKEFNKQLNSLDAEDVFEELNEISGGRDIVLLCYESPSEFSYRQLVAKWFVDNMIRCQEFGEPELTSREWLEKLGITDKELIEQHICPECP